MQRPLFIAHKLTVILSYHIEEAWFLGSMLKLSRVLVKKCFLFCDQEVVLAEKPLISEETDLLEPTLLDELICNISTLASVYHKPPSSFVEGRTAARRFTLPPRAEPSPGTII